MNVDLGRYTVEVLSAYGVSLGLLAALLILTVARARRVARDLAEIEARRAHSVKTGNTDTP